MAKITCSIRLRFRKLLYRKPFKDFCPKAYPLNFIFACVTDANPLAPTKLTLTSHDYQKSFLSKVSIQAYSKTK